MNRPSSLGQSWWVPNRLARMVEGRFPRFAALVALTYCAALAGLAITFWGGIDHPTTNLAALGIGLLFASFVGLFYLSVTILSTGAGTDRY